MVTVKFGVQSCSLNLAGKSMGEVLGDLQSILGLAGDEERLVNGRGAGPDCVFAAGDTVEFVKRAGEKG